jgi:8-oxo-dGTP pyrophosphatase MutT (NUDIX family)
LYQQKKDKFSHSFLEDDGKALKKLINGTRNAMTTWEIPKGRKSMNEAPLDTAIREFREETNISRQLYTVLYPQPIKSTYNIHKNRYSDHYFVTEINDPSYMPRYNFNSYDQRVETETIGWISINNIAILNMGQYMCARTTHLARMIIKSYKKFKKSVLTVV